MTTDVLVIGGGATGVGIVRDLAMRGMRAVLVERGDLAQGTTGRFHGLLHSGGRYVVKDPESARLCAEENDVLRRIIPHCLEDTGGLFVVTPADDEGYVERFVQGCHATGVALDEIAVSKALRREPLLNPRISRAFAVRDGGADSFLAARSIAEDARQWGAEVLTYHTVTALQGGDRICGAVCDDLRAGEQVHIHAEYVVNAAGAWAGAIAALAGIQLSVVAGKGTMIAMNSRLVNTVLNRCKLPADGDIIVPAHSVAVIGTTDIHVDDPDRYAIDAEEIALLLREGELLVPGISKARVLRAWAGVRPLYQAQAAGADRDISRTYTLLDHAVRDGVAGFVSIVGGKWTIFRRMAQDTVDLVAARLAVTVPCRTHELPVGGQGSGVRGQGSEEHSQASALPSPLGEGPGVRSDGQGAEGNLAASGRTYHQLGHPLAEIEVAASYGKLICECELVTRERLTRAIVEGDAVTIDDLRRATRLGMGPCQGGFCAYRAAGLWEELRPRDVAVPGSPVQSCDLLRDFVHMRWKGLIPILWGDQLRQARFDEILYLDLLGIDLL